MTTEGVSASTRIVPIWEPTRCEPSTVASSYGPRHLPPPLTSPFWCAPPPLHFPKVSRHTWLCSDPLMEDPRPLLWMATSCHLPQGPARSTQKKGLVSSLARDKNKKESLIRAWPEGISCLRHTAAQLSNRSNFYHPESGPFADQWPQGKKIQPSSSLPSHGAFEANHPASTCLPKYGII